MKKKGLSFIRLKKIALAFIYDVSPNCFEQATKNDSQSFKKVQPMFGTPLGPLGEKKSPSQNCMTCLFF